MATVTCAICDQPKDDCRIMLRDQYEQVRMSFPAPLAGADRDIAHGAMDRWPFCTLEAECKACRRTIGQEIAAQIAEALNDY